MKCTCQKDEIDEACVQHGRFPDPNAVRRALDGADIRNLREECDVARATAHAVTDLLVESRAEGERLRGALTEILRTSNDGESMSLAADALGTHVDRTEGE